jgi:hypothetical protein
VDFGDPLADRYSIGARFSEPFAMRQAVFAK